MFHWRSAAAPSMTGILPYDVRYALNWRKAQLGKEEILCLLRNGFENEALYLFLKGVARNPLRQRCLLGELSLRMIGIDDGGYGEHTAAIVRSFVTDFISWMPKDTTVAGAKVAQLSRQGFTHWHSMLHGMAERCAVDTRQTYIIGHAMFVGLPAFMQSHARRGKTLRVIIPDLALHPRKEICGFHVNGEVEMLRKDFPRDHEAVIVDDTCHTGACRATVEKFWRMGAQEAPDHEFIVMDQAA